MNPTPKQKRNYSAITLEEAMQLIGRDSFLRRQLSAPPKPPSDYFIENMRRLEVFDLETSEQAKTLLIDAQFADIVPGHPKLKIWKAAVLNTDTLKCFPTDRRQICPQTLKREHYVGYKAGRIQDKELRLRGCKLSPLLLLSRSLFSF